MTYWSCVKSLDFYLNMKKIEGGIGPDSNAATKRRLSSSCVLQVGFVSQKVMIQPTSDPHKQYSPIREGVGGIGNKVRQRGSPI